MPAIYSEDMPQAATYWERDQPDGYGGYTFKAPVEIYCRWQDVAQLFRDTQKNEVVSQSIVYTNALVTNFGYLAQGSWLDPIAYANPSELLFASEIRQVDASPDLDNAEILIKAYL